MAKPVVMPFRAVLHEAGLVASKEVPVAHNRSGSKNHRWKGGVRVRKDGYVLIYSPGHPFASKNFVLEHRLVMEAHLGRILSSDPWLKRRKA
jgi:hypothetical protein